MSVVIGPEWFRRNVLTMPSYFPAASEVRKDNNLLRVFCLNMQSCKESSTGMKNLFVKDD